MAVDKVLAPPSQKEVIDKINEIIDNLGNSSYSSTCPALTTSEGVVTWNISHNLNSNKVLVGLYDSNGKDVMRTVTVNSADSISVTWPSSTNIESGSYSIIILAEGSTGSGSTPTPVVDPNFIPKDTVIHVELNGSGDFTNLGDAINYLTGKWSNGTVIIELGEGTFNQGALTFDGFMFNIPCLIVKGQGSDKTTLYTPETTYDVFTYYIKNIKITFMNLKFQLVNSSGFTHCFVTGGSNQLSASEITIYSCNFTNFSRVIWADDFSIAKFMGENSINEFTENAIIAQAGQIVVRDTLSFSNSVNQGRAFFVNSCGVIKINYARVSYTKVSSQYNVTFNSYNNPQAGFIGGVINP